MNKMFNRFKESRDQMLLSAYLDDQLKTAERERLEERLRQEPELQQALAALRRTRSMIRSLPIRRAPRNFTLSPAMVGEQQRTPARPVFGMVSALAVLLLVFILIGDFLVIPEYVGMFPVSRSQAEDSVALELESVPQEEAETEPKAFAFPSSAPTDMLQPPEEPPLAMEQAVEEEMGEPVEEPATEEMPEAAVMADEIPEPTPSPGEGALYDESLRALEAETPTEGEDAMGKVVPGTETLEPIPSDTVDKAAEAESLLVQPEDGGIPVRQKPLWLQLLFWIIEISLVSVAIGAGLVAAYIWIRQRI